MYTNEFESVMSGEAIEKCCEYSENPEALKKLLSEISVSIRFNGVKKHFLNDENERLCGTFSIERGKRKIEFEFGFSLNNKGFMEGMLYDCLTSVHSEYHCSKSFNDFCGEFGYDTDSIKAEKTWKACLEQSEKLKWIFNDDEIDCLPS